MKIFIKKLYFTHASESNIWAVENSFSVFTKLTKINTKKKAKQISTFDFTTLYMTSPHDLLIKFLSALINFVFKSKTGSQIGFSETSVYWISKGCKRRYFTRYMSFHFASQNAILPSENYCSNERLTFLWA